MIQEGKEFENLTEQIFEKLIQNPQFDAIQRNVKIDGPDGKREIDILLLSKVAGFELKTVIECKDHGRKVSIGKVDELHSKMQDIKANKGILVSTKGFSSAAISKAKRLGMSLCTAHEALNPKWEIDVEFPILFTEIQPLDLLPSYTLVTGEMATGINKDDALNINDINISDLFFEEWKQGKVPYNIVEDEQQPFAFEKLVPPLYIRDVNKNKIFIDNFKFSFNLKIVYYFGYLNKQKNTQLLKNITEGTKQLFFNTDSILHYAKNFEQITKEKLPKFETLSMEIKAYPDMKVISSNVDIKKVD